MAVSKGSSGLLFNNHTCVHVLGRRLTALDKGLEVC